MPVFDFKHTPDEKNTRNVLIQHSARMRQKRQRRNRCWFWITATGNGSIIPVVFSPTRLKKTSFEFDEEDGTVSADILQIDARFVSLIKWLGENHINVRLSGEKPCRRLCSIQDPGDRIRWGNQAFS